MVETWNVPKSFKYKYVEGCKVWCLQHLPFLSCSQKWPLPPWCSRKVLQVHINMSTSSYNNKSKEYLDLKCGDILNNQLR